MRCLILFPPNRRAVRTPGASDWSADNTGEGARPPIGPLLVATYLKTHSPHEVKVLDCQILNLTDDQIRDEIRAFGPDLVGITAWTDFWYDARRCVELAKEADPRVHVTVGGPHASVYPEITLDHSGCDSVMVGDGEMPFLRLADALARGERPPDLPGLHFKEHGVKQGCEKFYAHADLDSLPAPDRTFLPYRLYRSVIFKGEPAAAMITSRGCPHRCSFCKTSVRKTVWRGAQGVVDELEEIARLGIRDVDVYDDTFTASGERVERICRGILDRRLDMDWAVRDRVSGVNAATLEWLARAGCRRIHFGIESGSDKTLKRIHKAITTDQAQRAIGLARKFGIQTIAYFLLGLPGETPEDMQETIQFAKKLDPDYATFSVAIPYPGTPMYQEGLKRGIIPYDFWLDYSRNPTPHFVIPYFWEEFLEKASLIKMREEATESFANPFSVRC